jgi:hypothetical protein
VLDELNNKMAELSNQLVSLKVRDLLKRNQSDESGLKTKSLSDEEKTRIRNLVKDLEQQVNDFVEAQKKKNDSAEEEPKKEARRTFRKKSR